MVLLVDQNIILTLFKLLLYFMEYIFYFKNVYLMLLIHFVIKIILLQQNYVIFFYCSLRVKILFHFRD